MEEATVIPYLHDDMARTTTAQFKAATTRKSTPLTAFVVVPLELVEGVIAYDSCSWSEDEENGGGQYKYRQSMAKAQPLTMRDSEGTTIEAAFSLRESLEPKARW